MAPSYQAIERQLQREGAGIGPSELHGALCAHLSATSSPSIEGWLQAAFGERLQPRQVLGDAAGELGELYQWTLAGIEDPEFGFRLYLPDDEAGLSRRTEALTHWCSGYLAALGLSGIEQFGQLPEEPAEFLQDLAEIARADFHVEDENETEEQALVELIEYARVGAMLVFETLRGPQAGEARH